MTADVHQDDPRSLWQGEKPAEERLSVGELRSRVERLARATRRRNYGGFLLCAVVLATCAWWFLNIDDPLARIGASLTTVAVGALAFQLFANQASERAEVCRASQMGEMSSVDFHRMELERQRDFHRGRRLWTRLLLFVPGPQISFLGFARAHPEVAGTVRLEAIAAAVLLAAAVPVNLWLARGYQRQIDQLNRFLKERP